MNKRSLFCLAATLQLMSLAACSERGAVFDSVAYQQEVLQWREWRVEQLKLPEGYLNQIGLYWLEPGTYRFGTHPSNDVVFGGSGAPEIGVFTVAETGVTMRVLDGIEVLHNDKPVSETLIPDDTRDDAFAVNHGSLAWNVVERVGRFGVRLRDYKHPFVETFGPLPYFEIDPSLRIEATLHRYPEPKIANVKTVIEGLGYHPKSPGMVEFVVDGNTYQLEAYSVDGKLFYVFGDQTNRDDTYGAGRFLYSAAPGADGKTVLDFNKSYSPPCAFNDFSTCPVASPRNRLPLRIEAGEKFDPKFHYSPDH